VNATKDTSQLGFPEWKPTTGWFHIFKHMIECRDAAKMGGLCFLVYAVVKSHINPRKGITFPSLDTIAHKAGCSVKSVSNCLKKLEELGYMERTAAPGRSSTYKLIEKLHFDGLDATGETVPMEATWDYVPVGVQKAVQDIKNVMVSGVLPEGSAVHIENLSINVQVLPNASTGNQFNLTDVKDKELRELIVRALERGQKGAPEE